MEPTIKIGSEVLVSGIPYIFSKPKIGDIVIFRKDEKIYIKRIVRTKNNEYSLAGDNEKDSVDIDWISKINIIGKLLFIF